MNKKENELNQLTTVLMNEVYKTIENQNEHQFISHYTSANALESMIENKTLRFSNAYFLNDNLEGNYIFDRIEFNLHKSKYLSKEFINNLKKLILHHNLFDKSHYLICSFSIDEDNVGMWNYYTKNREQNGYSLTFDMRELMLEINSLRNIQKFVLTVFHSPSFIMKTNKMK